MPRYKVLVDRCIVQSLNIEVVAEDHDAAGYIALEIAGNYDFNEGTTSDPEYSVADGGVEEIDCNDNGFEDDVCPKSLIRELLLFAEDLMGADAEDSPKLHDFVKRAEALGVDTTPDWTL